MLETFTVATFSDHLGETFRLYVDSARSLNVELIEATDLSERFSREPAEGRRRPFFIAFRGPRTILLPQQISRMEHDTIGSFDLFLVPIGLDQAGLRYEAVFS